MIAEYVCSLCGEIHLDQPFGQIYGRPVCETCWNRSTTVCVRCGERIPTGDARSVDGNTWCQDCAETYAYECAQCGNYTETTETVMYRDGEEEWCTDCCVNEDVSRCSNCGEYVHNDNAFIDCNSESVCPSCRHEHYVECSNCGGLVREDCAIEENGDWYCSNCHDSGREHNLEPYEKTNGVDFRHVGNDPTPNLFLGVELEVISGIYGLPDHIRNVVDGVNVKYDGSLGDGGSEIVSQPFTPAYHLTTEWWNAVLDVCKEHRATSHDNGRCGLHVHINRSYLDNEDAVFRLDRLIQNHCPYWVRFSRRGSEQLEQWCRIESNVSFGINRNDTVDAKKRKWRYGKGEFSNERYRAVNTENKQTVELRLFRGTLNKTTLFATIEAAAALAIIAKNRDTSWVESSTWKVVAAEMVSVLKEHDLPSGDLTTYLEVRDIA